MPCDPDHSDYDEAYEFARDAGLDEDGAGRYAQDVYDGFADSPDEIDEDWLLVEYGR